MAVTTAAMMRETNLFRANLSEANLFKADLRQVDVRRANLREAWLGSTGLQKPDLHEVVGLETVQYHRPSVIGMQTIYQSQGQIPAVLSRAA